MIYSVAVENNDGDILEMILAEPELSGFAIIRIDGLGPEDADISSTDITYGDGSVTNNTRIRSKQIQFDILYLWHNTVEESRQILYNYFTVTKNVRLYFRTETKYVYIDGTVQANKPDIFNEQSGASIVVDCPDPYFKEVTDYVEPIIGVDSRFIFPFCNNSLTDNLLIFGDVLEGDNRTISYQGTKDTGFTIEATYDGATAPNVRFEIGCNENVLIFNNVMAVKGGTLYINTRNGQKQALFIKDGVATNIIGKIDIDNSNWLTLRPGLNDIFFSSDRSNPFSEFKIHTNILYRGI